MTITTSGRRTYPFRRLSSKMLRIQEGSPALLDHPVDAYLSAT
jgi:hypothetical protein